MNYEANCNSEEKDFPHIPITKGLLQACDGMSSTLWRFEAARVKHN